jgi:Flp pilus assembly protein TadG
MAELTLVLPALFLVLFAVIQFGIIFNNYVALTDAVRAGARFAAVSRLDPNAVPDTQAKVASTAGDLDGSKLNVTVQTPTGAFVHGDDVTVTATYPCTVSLVGWTIPCGPLKSTTTERVE